MSECVCVFVCLCVCVFVCVFVGVWDTNNNFTKSHAACKRRSLPSEVTALLQAFVLKHGTALCNSDATCCKLYR